MTCQCCNGTRGVPGNENVFGNSILCDYCHSDIVALHKEAVVSGNLNKDEFLFRLCRVQKFLFSVEADGIIEHLNKK